MGTKRNITHVCDECGAEFPGDEPSQLHVIEVNVYPKGEESDSGESEVVELCAKCLCSMQTNIACIQRYRDERLCPQQAEEAARRG